MSPETEAWLTVLAAMGAGSVLALAIEALIEWRDRR